ncbi:MAG TPA: class I SAM-dependent methyltransferase [Gaiellaceae bacterium]|nr:class I SAM-dependent methyltransferase [Gaiellaceae bacterium]
MNGPSLSYCKLCELADFRDPDLRALIRDMATEDIGPEYPDGTEHRKPWEVAMTARALRDFGALREDAEILGVGAGREATVFWLTRHVRRVFATDLYLMEDSWSETDSGAQMLVAPDRGVQMDWNPRRLIVQHMDGRKLSYEDESFDGIFSSGSIEHFGTLDEIRESVEEMHRVLRPGGVAAIATEYRLAGPPPGMPGTVLFDERELRRVVLDGLDWELASPLDLSSSDQTLTTVIDWDSLFETDMPKPSMLDKVKDLFGMEVNLPPPQIKQGPLIYPHVVLQKDEHMWTSVHVALIKPGS